MVNKTFLARCSLPGGNYCRCRWPEVGDGVWMVRCELATLVALHSKRDQEGEAISVWLGVEESVRSQTHVAKCVWLTVGSQVSLAKREWPGVSV